MRRYQFIIVPVIAALAVVDGSAAGQRGTAFLLGRALDADSGQPIAGAQATLASIAATAGAPPATTTVVTTADGHFLFRDLAAGRYSLTVSAAGYVSGGYLRRSPIDTRAHPIAIEEGERRTGADVRLWRLGSISGRVVDENGRPATGASVSILRRSYRVGRLSLDQAARVTADDRGTYVAAGLPPAEYVVGVRFTQLTVPVSLSERFAAANAARLDATRAPELASELFNGGVPSPGATGYRVGDWVRQISGTPFIGYTPPQPGAGGRVPSYRSAYFINTEAPTAATTITLRAGEDRRSVDLALVLDDGTLVSGRLVGPDGQVQDLGIALLPVGTEALATHRGFEAAVAASDANGAFTFLGVLPGTYRLRAVRMPRAPVRGQPPAPVLWAEQTITVGRDDVADVLVTLKPGVKIGGRVEFSGTKPAPQRLDQVSLGVRAVGAGVMDRASMTYVSPQGTFATHGDVGGRHFIEARPPFGWTVKSITVAGRDVTNQPFDLSSDAHDVLVTFTDALSRLSGTISDATGAPDAQANVIVFPSDVDGWRRDEFDVRRTLRLTGRADGTFALANFPAGSYFVVAVNDEVAAEWASPTVLERLVAGATRVVVREGESTVVALRTFTPK